MQKTKRGEANGKTDKTFVFSLTTQKCPVNFRLILLNGKGKDGVRPPDWILVMAIAIMGFLPPARVGLMMQRWFRHG
jgi:ABC-type glycerol-3-phosphate transport system permease component